jgi:polyhydroxybutyrate depolymerase
MRFSISSFLHRLTAALIAACIGQSALAALAPGDYVFSLTHQGLQRGYLLHVPPQAGSGRALPIMLSFHGAGSHAEVMRTYTRMDLSADRDGYIVAYPNGSSGIGNRFLTWNAGNCCGPAVALQVDDVGFSLAVLDDIAARVPIDRSRVYATGISNGAMMAYRLAAEASHRIAAVAGVAGSMSTSRFSPSQPIAVLHIHSTQDHIARFDGGFGAPSSVADTRTFHMPVEKMLRQWLDHNGCPVKPALLETISGEPGTPDETHSAIRRVYRPCRQGVEVALLQLSGAGHVWPGGVRDYMPQLLGTGTAVIDANTEIWRFVSRFRR